MTQDEIVKMYLQVSKELCNDTEWCWAGVGEPLQMFAKLVAAKAIKELESQEPVAIVTGDAWETDIRFLPEGMANPNRGSVGVQEARPPQRTWVGLTKDEQSFIYDQVKQIVDSKPFWVRFADSIEAKLKTKNND